MTSTAPTAARPLTLAVGQGRVLQSTLPLLRAIDLPVPDEPNSRSLEYPLGPISLQMLRNWDVPVYVSEGAADLGIVGNDILGEWPERSLYSPVDLGINRCRLAIAAPEGASLPERPRIATRHTHATRRWYQSRGNSVHLIPLQGSLEYAPHSGLADGICDLVQTGSSLRENHLVEVATVLEVSARLILNKTSARVRMTEIDELVGRLVDGAKSLQQ